MDKSLWPLIAFNDVILPVLAYLLISIARVRKGHSARRAWAFVFVMLGWIIISAGGLLFTMLIAMANYPPVGGEDPSQATLGFLILLVVPLFVSLYFFSAADRLRRETGNGDARS